MRYLSLLFLGLFASAHAIAPGGSGQPISSPAYYYSGSYQNQYQPSTSQYQQYNQPSTSQYQNRNDYYNRGQYNSDMQYNRYNDTQYNANPNSYQNQYQSYDPMNPQLVVDRENQYQYNLYDRNENRKDKQQFYYYQNYQDSSGNFPQSRTNRDQQQRSNRNYYFNPRTDD